MCRNRSKEFGTTLGARLQRQFATGRRQTLAHAGQAVAERRRLQRGAVVADAELDALADFSATDVDDESASVAQRIGDALLGAAQQDLGAIDIGHAQTRVDVDAEPGAGNLLGQRGDRGREY